MFRSSKLTPCERRILSFQFWCDIWNVCDYVLCGVSFYTILFISVDRYLSLKYPLTYQVIRDSSNNEIGINNCHSHANIKSNSYQDFSLQVNRTKRKAKLWLIAIWIGVICVFTPYIYLSQIFLGKERDPLECSTYYLTSISLTFIMVTCVHWFVIACTGKYATFI